MSREEDEPVRSWLKAIRRLRDPDQSPLPYLPWAIATAWRSAPLEAALNVLAGLLQGVAPAAVLVAIRRLIDLASGGAGSGSAVIVAPLFWLAGLMLVSELGGAIQPVTNNRLQEKLSVYVREQILIKASTLSAAQYETAETYNLIERAGGGQVSTIARIYMILGLMLMGIVRAGSALALLVALSPTLGVLAGLVAIPIAWAGFRQGKRWFRLWGQQSSLRRRSQYLADLIADRKAATELRAYQLLPFFLQRWGEAFRTQRDEMLANQWRGVREGWLADLGATALTAGALALVAYLAGGGTVAAGQVFVLAQAVQLLQAAMSNLATQMGDGLQAMLPVIELQRFLRLPAEEPPLAEGRPFPSPLRHGIRFEGVSFAYPGQAEPVLADLSFAIPAGETVALVGANGAGKSTLTKLLLGLYAPTAGRITYDGVDLRAIAPGALRQQVSCIFQDFARYDLTVAENVAAGRIGASKAEIAAAGSAAGLAAVVADLPDGYDTLLGKSFQGGHELSGGQWQRVALARAFVRNAQVIVLDEPSAALDPRAELALFGKFVALMQGRTTLLISHRLGSARLADRIIVLAGGRVAETGTHADLMAAGGLYAELFHAQAQWYQDGETEVVL